VLTIFKALYHFRVGQVAPTRDFNENRRPRERLPRFVPDAGYLLSGQRVRRGLALLRAALGADFVGRAEAQLEQLSPDEIETFARADPAERRRLCRAMGMVGVANLGRAAQILDGVFDG
jgi:hypothetical protein